MSGGGPELVLLFEFVFVSAPVLVLVPELVFTPKFVFEPIFILDPESVFEFDPFVLVLTTLFVFPLALVEEFVLVAAFAF